MEDKNIGCFSFTIVHLQASHVQHLLRPFLSFSVSYLIVTLFSHTFLLDLYFVFNPMTISMRLSVDLDVERAFT